MIFQVQNKNLVPLKLVKQDFVVFPDAVKHGSTSRNIINH